MHLCTDISASVTAVILKLNIPGSCSMTTADVGLVTILGLGGGTTVDTTGEGGVMVTTTTRHSGSRSIVQ